MQSSEPQLWSLVAMIRWCVVGFDRCSYCGLTSSRLMVFRSCPASVATAVQLAAAERLSEDG